MRTHLAAAAAALVVCLASSVPVHASIVVAGDKLKLYNGIGTKGGVFHVDIKSNGYTAPASYDFDTFCVQTAEFISFSPEYYVQSVTKQVLGSSVANQNGTPLASFAAWLYTGFLGEDSVSIPGFVATNLTHVDTMQAGIWLSMGYSVAASYYNSTLLNTWHAAYVASTWSDTLTPNAPGSLNYGYQTGNVWIMNLVTKSNDTITAHNQDQLVHIPGTGNPPPPAPEPVSFLIWSLLAACVGSFGLRRRES